MSSTKVVAGSTKIIVSPPNNDDSFGIMQPTTTTTTTIQPTNADVLCGRGSGIRRHPGNKFYNRLLRENYEKYKSAPKGNKVSIVKKILMLVKQNEGRFLERTTTTTSCQNGSSSYQYLYTELGDERALNKTAQAFRDIRATMEKHHSPSFKSGIRGNKKSTPETSPSMRTPGRPTFRERLAMLEREQQWKKVGNENKNSDDDDNDDESEEEVSDTETEESFPINE